MKYLVNENNLDSKYLDKIIDTSFNPIFILGLQRSGTSILYKILASTQSFNIISAYHIIEYNRLIFNHINGIEKNEKKKLAISFGNKFQMNREIDQLEITPEFPEEYGFIIAKKTRNAKINDENLQQFIELCKKIQFISDQNKPILMKNPFDFSNFLYIKKKFPVSKFILIHRNPIRTLNSQLKAMRTLLKKKSHYMARLSQEYDKIFDNRILLSFYRLLYSSYNPYRTITAMRRMIKETDKFLDNINYLELNKDYINVKYEDLCQFPQKTIIKIMKFLDMSLVININYKDFIKQRKTTNLKEIQNIENYLYKRMNNYFSFFKYIKNEF